MNTQHRPRRPLSGRLMMALTLLLACLAAACSKPADAPAAPPPQELGSDVRFEELGYYCGMRLAEHPGPKGQIHLASRAQPLWFSSVRDTIAFMRLPEEPRDIIAVYVNDMGRARSWDQPEAGTWVDARSAWYVTGSAVRGGMGAPEAIPFAQAAAAEAFQVQHGGRVVRLDQIPDAYVLGPVELVPTELPGREPQVPAHDARTAGAGTADAKRPVSDPPRP